MIQDEGGNQLMSVSLILQDENKKTVGGYLWIFLTLSTVITLHIGNYDFSDLNSITNFISVYILLASFLSLAFITIRPETLFNRLLFKDRRIPPYFRSDDTLTIIEIIQSPLLAKERDNFWGNILIGTGFVIAIFIPLYKIIDPEKLIFLEVIKILITSLAATVIIGNWYFNQRKELRRKLEITWRYMEMLSQMGWKEYYTEQIKALEESLKLRLWKKAEYQINELNEAYRDDLDHIKGHLINFNHSYQFLLGASQFKSTFLNFNFDDLKKFYNRARILGMQYHDLELYAGLTTRINEFQNLKNEFNRYSIKLSDRYGHIRAIIEKSDTLKDKADHFQRLFRQLDYTLYHIEPNIEEFPEFDRVREYALESKEDEVLKWFEGVKNTTEFYKKFTDDFRENFNEEIDKRMSKLGENPTKEIESYITEIHKFIEDFLGHS